MDPAKVQERQLRTESGAEVTFHYHEAPHAFHNDVNPQGNYRPEAAKLAGGRTIAFLREKTK